MNKENLKAARTRLKFSVDEMAKHLNTPKRTYEGWEQGRKIPGAVDVAIKFVKIKKQAQ